MKLYLNDVGILTSVLYKNNINAILGDANSISLGSVYESTVAMQLASLGHSLFYYDNRHKGEVDFLIDDYNNLTVVPIEVKSGKDYTIHSALNSLLNNAHSRIRMGIEKNLRKSHCKNPACDPLNSDFGSSLFSNF